MLVPLLLATLGAATSDVEDGRPDVVLVIIDDVGANIAESVDMPVLDALASEGVRFTRGYSHAWCAPTRDSIYRSVWRGGYHGKLCNSLPEPRTLDHGEHFLGKSMAAAGYATAFFGKWHQGTARPLSQVAGFGTTPIGWPVAPHFFGWETVRACIPDDSTVCNQGPGSYTNWVRIDDGTVSTERRHATVETRDAFLDWWAEKADEPRFAVVAFQACHAPFDPPPAWILPTGYPLATNATARENYEAMVASVDFVLGEMLTAIWSDDPWILVIGDNGTPGCHPVTNDCDTNVALPGLELRSKLTTYEPGVRVPFVIAGPRGRDALVADDLVHVVDLYPTILDLAGIEIPAGLQGQSLVPALRGRPLGREWVVVSSSGGEGAAIERAWKLRRDRAGDERLFDLERDPQELAPLEPDDHPQIAARLRARFNQAN